MSFDHITDKSRSGWNIFYANSHDSWASKLQTQVALSNTEIEYIALSSSLRDVITIMDLVVKIRNHNFAVICTECSVRCLRIIKVSKN